MRVLAITAFALSLAGCAGNQSLAPVTMTESMMNTAAREAAQNLRAQGQAPMTSDQCSSVYTPGETEVQDGFEVSPLEICIKVANEFYEQSPSRTEQTGGVIAKKLVEVPASLEEEAREAVSRELRDPSSAQFRDIYGVQKITDGNIYVCGNVNGKNAYGGYAGFKAFSYTGGMVLIAGESGSLDSDLVKLVCVDGVQ